MFWKIHGNSILDIIHMLKSVVFVVFVPGAFHVPNILVGMVGLCWIIVYSKAKKKSILCCRRSVARIQCHPAISQSEIAT